METDPAQGSGGWQGGHKEGFPWRDAKVEECKSVVQEEVAKIL